MSLSGTCHAASLSRAGRKLCLIPDRLCQSVGREYHDGCDAQAGAENRAGQYIAEEMHAEHNAGNRDAGREKIQRPFQAGIEIADDEGDGKGCHGVAGGEGKLIGREYARPAVRLQVARTLAVADFFQEFEDENTSESRAGGSTYRG